MKDLKFSYCDVCKKVVLSVVDKAVPTVCCGKPMTVLTANTTDAATEKHVPVVEVKDSQVVVNVGSVEHPMTEEHHISFIAVVFEDGSYMVKDLEHTGKPEAVFPIGASKPVAAYEFCNLHGLWKYEI